MDVSLYIFSKLKNQYIEVDLFNDETITIESSLQDIRAIDSTNTDYSQNFKVPCTPNNESLFNHWYDSSIVGGFDNRVDIDALLYVDGELFRKGVIKINSTNTLRNAPVFYDITFYGRLRSLLDKFINKKLKDVVAIGNIPYNRTFTSIQAAIGTVDENAYDIMYPLISTYGSWAYNTGSAALDISTEAGAINTQTLYPAVRLSRVFQALEEEFDISFTGTFLTDERFTRAYVLFGGSATDSAKREVRLNWPNGTISTSVSTVFERIPGNPSRIRYKGVTVPGNLARLTLSVTADPSTEWSIQTYLDGSTINPVTGQPFPIFNKSSTSLQVFEDFYNTTPSGYVGNYEFVITVNNSLVFSVDAILSYSGDVSVIDTGDVAVTSTLTLTELTPDILVTDFFKGVLNMFNLSCYSIREDAFQIETLREWYELGNRYNIDPYVRKDYTYKAVPLYDKIDFKYKPSKAILNNLYRNSNSGGTDYGILEYTNPITSRGDNIDIIVPFENILFQKVVGSNNGPKVAYLLDNTLKPFVPGLSILYHTGWRGNIGPTNPGAIDTFYISDGLGGTVSINLYNQFSQELQLDPQYTTVVGINQPIEDSGRWYSLNFGLEDPLQAETTITGSLFDQYHQFRVEQAFDIRTRFLEVQAKIPSPILNKLELNDAIIIEGEAYQINNQSTDLYTGLTTFELLNQRFLSTVEPTPPISCDPFIVTVVWTGNSTNAVVTLDPSSSPNLGPFVLSSDTGAVIPTNLTRADLIAGVSVNFPPDATTITIRSVGNCTNEVTQPIEGYPGPLTVTNGAVTCTDPTKGGLTSTFTNGTGVYSYTAIASTEAQAAANVQGAGVRFAIAAGQNTYTWNEVLNGTWYVAVLDSNNDVAVSDPLTVDCSSTPVPECDIITPTAVWVSN